MEYLDAAYKSSMKMLAPFQPKMVLGNIEAGLADRYRPFAAVKHFRTEEGIIPELSAVKQLVDIPQAMGIAYQEHVMRTEVLFNHPADFPTLGLACAAQNTTTSPAEPGLGDDAGRLHGFDWGFYACPAVIQSDKSCVISSILVVMAAIVTKADETVHGVGSFRFEYEDHVVEGIKRMCEREKVWKRRYGASSVAGVVNVILSTNGVRVTVNNTNYLLRVQEQSRIWSHEDLVGVLDSEGPVVGTFCLEDNEKYKASKFYPGRFDPKSGANHAVVCTGRTRYLKKELYLEIIDSYESDGPVKYVQYSAFHEFTSLKVDVSIEPTGMLANLKKMIYG